MKKFLLIAVALVSMTMVQAQSVANDKKATTEKKCAGDCKDHKDGVKCTKPADQQCDKCKKANAAIDAAAAAKKDCCKEKAEGAKKDCCKEKAEGAKKCAGQCKNHKEGAEKKCAGECKNHKAAAAAAEKKCSGECKDHKDGEKCTKPADQQCDKCKKANAKK